MQLKKSFSLLRCRSNSNSRINNRNNDLTPTWEAVIVGSSKIQRELKGSNFRGVASLWTLKSCSRRITPSVR